MAETNKIRTKVHIQAAVNDGISFEDLRKAFEDACNRLEQAAKQIESMAGQLDQSTEHLEEKQEKIEQLEAENKRLREILAREVDDGRAAVDDIGIEAWIEQALKEP